MWYFYIDTPQYNVVLDIWIKRQKGGHHGQEKGCVPRDAESEWRMGR
jgi:hypothetical protein